MRDMETLAGIMEVAATCLVGVNRYVRYLFIGGGQVYATERKRKGGTIDICTDVPFRIYIYRTPPAPFTLEQNASISYYRLCVMRERHLSKKHSTTVSSPCFFVL